MQPFLDYTAKPEAYESSLGEVSPTYPEFTGFVFKLQANIIDPDDRSVIIYRADSEVTVLTDGDTLTIPELLPAWNLPVSSLWRSELAY